MSGDPDPAAPVAVGTPVALTLRVARGAAAQQAALDAWLAATAGPRRAVVVEGGFAALDAPAGVPVARLAAGCVCCLGLVPLRVTLQRQLRARPQAILLLVAGDGHLPALRTLIAGGTLGPLQLVDAAPAS